MAALLELDHVTQRFPRSDRGRHERLALRDVTLDLHAGELVGVWGTRHSGRSTLTLVAAGLIRPTEGMVRFDGEDLARTTMLGARGGIGYCEREFDPVMADTVLEHVAAPLLSGAIANSRAERAAFQQLERVGAAEFAEMTPDDLDTAEIMRVALARAMITRPRLLVVDEPTTGVRGAQERPLLRLLPSFARDDGVAVLMTADDAAALAGVDRALSLNAGVLRGASHEDADDATDDANRVVPLRMPESR